MHRLASSLELCYCRCLLCPGQQLPGRGHKSLHCEGARRGEPSSRCSALLPVSVNQQLLE